MDQQIALGAVVLLTIIQLVHCVAGYFMHEYRQWRVWKITKEMEENDRGE